MDSMRKKMAGRGANIQNLNQKILSTLDIPIPPIEMQEQFATFVEQADISKHELKQACSNLQEMTRSLLNNYE